MVITKNNVVGCIIFQNKETNFAFACFKSLLCNSYSFIPTEISGKSLFPTAEWNAFSEKTTYSQTYFNCLHAVTESH